MIQPLEWIGRSLKIVDQTRLPSRLIRVVLTDYREVAEAIKTMKVRGAPVIGITAGYGIALGAMGIRTSTKREFMKKFEIVLNDFAVSRPTAVDLFHTIERMQSVANRSNLSGIKRMLLIEAEKIHTEQIEATYRLARFGAGLVPDEATVLTHCNTGPLAAGGVGTALGIVFEAVRQGKKITVMVDETRPLLQGARLTTWELKQAGVPQMLITDSMAGFFLSRGVVDCVIVGADRVTAVGDFANKIGTYTLAVLARENHVPFYVAAPLSTIDVSLSSGQDIPIEERSESEVTHLGGRKLTPPGIPARNPAFDVTPADYITAIVTDRGIISGPSRRKILKLVKEGN